MSNWYAIRSATRQEFRAAGSLEELGISVYLPVEARWRRTPRTRVRVESPLFPGYLFALLDDVGIALAHEADGVHAVIGAFRTKATIEPGRLEALRSAQQAGEFDRTLNDPAVKTYRPGEVLQVTEGPFSGWIGSVVKAKGKGRLILMTELFGKKRQIELPVGSLVAA